MADIAKIKEVRERTGIGFADCKAALAETDWDVEAAITHIRKQSAVKAAKKADREASEGRIMIKLNPDASAGAIVEVNVETDFAANSDQFGAFVAEVTDAVLDQGEEVLDSFEKRRQELVQTIGENVNVRRAKRLTGNPGSVAEYLHTDRKVGCVVRIDGGGDNVKRDVAMHATAMSPLVVNIDDLPSGVVDKEKEILMARARDDGRPEHLLERIISGQVKKFQSENCLVEQAFVKDPKSTVGTYLKQNGAKCLEFVRMQVGEVI